MNSSDIKEKVIEKINSIYQWAIENHSSKGVEITKEVHPTLRIGKSSMGLYFIEIYPIEVVGYPLSDIESQIIVKIENKKLFLNLINNNGDLTWEEQGNIKEAINNNLIKNNNFIDL